MDVSGAQIGDWVWTWLRWESDEVSRIRRPGAHEKVSGFINRRDMLAEARAIFRARRIAVPALDRGELHVVQVSTMNPDNQTSLATAEENHQKMERAFALVKHKGDWKAPIQALVKVEDMEELGLGIADIRDAVEYFTATEATFSRRSSGYVVTAAGYRAGPAGP